MHRLSIFDKTGYGSWVDQASVKKFRYYAAWTIASLTVCFTIFFAAFGFCVYWFGR